MRLPWPPCPWKSDNGGGLGHHRLYNRAKNLGDVEAADEIIEEFGDTVVLDRIVDEFRDKEPVIVAPTLEPDNNRNSIAITYATWLSRELELGLCETVFQRRGLKRAGRGNWYRLAYPRAFYGQVLPGGHFIIADDVCTLGGTIADLRSFLESQGGIVICATCLSARDGNHVGVALTDDTLAELSGLDAGLDTYWKEEFDYGLECFTELEARFLVGERCGVDGIRTGIDGARDTGDVLAS
jgi:hypothetical protein